MSTWDHRTLEKSRLLSGALDEEVRASWPEGARQHVAQCRSCQTWIRAELLLHAAGRVLRPGLPGSVAALPPPTLTGLQRRLVARRPAPVVALVRDLPTFGGHVFRSEDFPTTPGALELVRTAEGVRAWDPEATHLLVFTIPRDAPPRLAGEAASDSPGVGIDLPFEVAQPAWVVAVATMSALDSRDWMLWLADAFRVGGPMSTDVRGYADRVHLATIEVLPAFQVTRVHVADEPLPLPRPACKALLAQAAASGRAGCFAEAASQYRQALGVAQRDDDLGGRVRASLGLAKATNMMGYEIDAERVIDDLIAYTRLDRASASWVCREMANTTLGRGDLARAREWLAEVRALVTPGDVWGAVAEVNSAVAEGQWESVIAVTEDADLDPISPHHAAYVRLERAGALVRRGRLAEGLAVMESVDEPSPAQVEVREVFGLVRMLVRRAQGLDAGGDELLAWLEPSIRVTDERGMASWERTRLVRAVLELLESGDQASAWKLVRLMFLAWDRALDPDVPLLAVVASPGGVLAVNPFQPGVVRRLSVSAEEMRRLVARSRQQVQAGGDDDAAGVLGALLLPDASFDERTILVGSDGTLTGAPMYAVLSCVTGGRRPIPSLRILTGFRREPPLSGALPTIAGLADTRGDLPYADREVLRHEASVYLRGHQVTNSAYARLGPVGLLHFGVHARREQGLPALMLADGPLGPAEIGASRLEGAPLVVLAGFSTAVSAVHRGVERSLAEAFLGAGASAVVAHLWPVQDRLAFRFVREVVGAWPFPDVPLAVARAVTALRDAGLPARVWAAPEVY